MYHQENQRSRSRSGKKLQNAGAGIGGMLISDSDLSPITFDLSTMGRSHGEGIAKFRKRAYAMKLALDSIDDDDLPIEEGSFGLGFRRRSSIKASGTTIKAGFSEGFLNQLEIRRPSPGVVAKLMGLESMPPREVPKQKKGRGNFQKMKTVGFKEEYVTCEGHSLWMNTNESQEIKDVFEVVQTSKVEKHTNQKVRKGGSISKKGEIDMTFIKQKFIDEKHLPTDGVFQKTEGFNSTLDIQDSTYNIPMKIHEEPNLLFTKQLPDLKYDSSSQHASHITILKSSKDARRETNDACCSYRRNPERCTHMQTADRYGCQSLKEHSCYLPNKLSMSRYEETTEAYHHPTKIVVLKPSLENMTRPPLESSYDNFNYRCNGNKEFPRCEIQELHSKDSHKLCDDEKETKYKNKSSREISRGFTEQIRNASGTQRAFPSKLYSMYETPRIRSDTGNLNKPDTFEWTPNQFDDCCNSFGASSSSSSETSVNREARKRLSKRWKTIHQFQEAGLVGRRSKTLGEMLALSKAKAPTMVKDPEVSNSSKDGWKNRCSTNSPRSSPASSPPYNFRKSCSRNRAGGFEGEVIQRGSSSLRINDYCNRKPQIYYDVEENELLERVIYVNSKKSKEQVHAGYLSKKRSMITRQSKYAIADERNMVDRVSILECNDEKIPCVINEKLVKQPQALTVLAKDQLFSGYNQKDLFRKVKSIEHLREDPPPTRCNISESASPVSSDEADRPSPVSILEPPSKEEKSGCFDRINADLHELRLQLKLFKLDSADKHHEEVEAIDSSDDETSEDCSFETLQNFRDEEERDFSYLLDVVIKSGIRSSEWNMLFYGRFSREDMIGTDLFDKLEKKYKLLDSWSRPDRKLLFDLINAILVDIVDRWANRVRGFHPSWARDSFVEDVWQMVVGRRKDLSGDGDEKILDPRWLDLRNDVDTIGQEIERMMEDDLLEELVSEVF